MTRNAPGYQAEFALKNRKATVGEYVPALFILEVEHRYPSANPGSQSSIGSERQEFQQLEDVVNGPASARQKIGDHAAVTLVWVLLATQQADRCGQSEQEQAFDQ